jgi:hypothetical protein
MLKTIVVNRKHSDYDVYIGRPSKWGNPFFLDSEDSRAEVIHKYREWIITQEHLIRDLPSLAGKKLGCWCSPRPCHGDVLVDLIEGGKKQGDLW